MKRKGRFVLEAAALIPGMCLLLVYLFYFTLYAHDQAAGAQTALQVGVKAIYREGKSSGQIEEAIRADLQQKLTERLLWVRNPEIEVKVSPLQVEIRISGGGGFWPKEQVEIQQKIYRIQASESVRRSRWLKE